MRNDWPLGFLLVPALFGCSDLQQAEESSITIAAPLTFAFEISSIDLCSEGGANNEAPCSNDGAACWLKFSQAADDDLTAITGSDQFTEDGRFWIAGRGRIRSEVGRYGHLDQYPCEVEMTSVDVFSKIPN